jgi:hypothetical protein
VQNVQMIRKMNLASVSAVYSGRNKMILAREGSFLMILEVGAPEILLSAIRLSAETVTNAVMIAP